ncbi:cystatin [Hydra vulgaris]|uniref:cystatin n=1 Tax=Hydra vulgaris TaxID=6087 RepID=UPI00019253DB|nr:cystatin isoform X2 [Hydra vulgaris]
MIKVLGFLILSSLCFANGGKDGDIAGGKKNLSQEDIKELVSANGDFSKGLGIATEMINNGTKKHSKKTHRLVIQKIVNATSQVVAGIKYDVDVKMEESDCKNTKQNEHKKKSVCKVKKNCNVKIWSRPWIAAPSNLNVTVSCEEHK